jgi:hypothetical protein
VGQSQDTLGGGELGDGLGALRHGVLCKLTGQDEANGGLNLPRSHGGLLVVPGQHRGLGGNLQGTRQRNVRKPDRIQQA